MEYQVPQFIEVEDKIIGPLTFKQFVYIAGGIGVCVIVFFYLPFFVALLVALPAAGFAAALAFYRVNNKPFIEILEAGFAYITRGKLFLWKKETKNLRELEMEAARRNAMPAPVVARPRPGLSVGKLHDLAWSLDIKDPTAGQTE